MDTNTTIYRTRPAVLMLALLAGTLTLAGCDKKGSSESTSTATSASSVTDTNVAQKIEQARTPAEHEALAAYYDARAETAQREGVEDRELRGQYERRWHADSHPMGPGARTHFEGLIEGQERSASHYHAMADWHRQMAQRVQQSAAADE